MPILLVLFTKVLRLFSFASYQNESFAKNLVTFHVIEKLYDSFASYQNESSMKNLGTSHVIEK